MSDAVWSRLAARFPVDAVAWVPVEVADDGAEVRVAPQLRADALVARLDAAAGVAGWGVAYAALDGGAVACHLTVAGVTKGAVAPPALAGGAAATAAAAFAAAARLGGARPPFPDGASAWVPCDPETLQPLHAPEIDADAVAAGPDEHVAAADPGARAAGGPRAAAAPVPASSAAAASAVAGAPSAATAPAPIAAPAPDASPAKPAGQVMIDRLVERLKEEGQGLAAARLLVRYGGYGKDPEAARELYAQLRALLRAAPVAAGRAEAEPA